MHQYYDDRTTPDYCLQEFIDDKNNASFINHADAGFLMTGRLPLSIYCGGREVKDIATSLNDDPWDQPYEDIFDRSASTYVERNPLGEAPFEYSALIVYMEPMAFREAKLISVYCIAQAYLNVSVYSGDLVPAICFHHRDASSRNARIILSRNSVGITAFNNTPWNAGAQKETDLPYSITSPAAAANLSHWLSGDNSQWFEAYGGCWPITGSGTYSAIQRLHDVAVRIDLTIDLLDGELFGAVKGREYLSTWDTRKTTGNLIENPADVIESVLREELGVAGVDIDTGAFDAASSARSTNYDMAGQVVTVKDSEDVIDEVCKSSGLMYYNDLTGKEKLTPLDKKATQDFRFNYHDIIEDSIRVRFSRRDEVVSSFILNYAYNPISDSYRGRVYCNKDNSSFLSGGSTYENLCDAAYDITGLVVEREFNCKWINDSAIAHNHLKFLINWLTYLKTFVILETYFDQIGIELGDQGELALERHLPSTTEDSYFVVESISTKRSNRRIRFELIEIRAAS